MTKPCIPLLSALALTAAFAGRAAAQEAIWLETLPVTAMSSGWNQSRAGRSVDNNPLKLHGITYAHGIGTHAVSRMAINLKGSATRFTAVVGVDDEKTGFGSVTFQVRVDGKTAYRSPVLRGGGAVENVSVDLTGAKKMELIVGDGRDGIDSDHADWANAMIALAPGATERPVASVLASYPPPVLAFGDPPQPRIHNPFVTGATPGRAFMFRIPATGQGPLTYSAKGLPAGLSLDPRTGIITGSLKTAGRTPVQITVRGPKGKDTRTLMIVGGEKSLAQTPPMGWNSWNVWGTSVDDAKVRAAADWMVKSGLAAHGFQYINIDDAWEAGRDANGEIQTNAKFPDMKALSDYVHSKGLKLGIYSSPGPTTCGGYTASWQHEQQDANTFAKWGVDYLKYDWCSYGNIEPHPDRAGLEKPYRLMSQALDNSGRDIVFSLCQYGMGNVWEWGKDVGGNVWRTTGDINDSWSSLSGIAFSQDGHEKFAGPGHWNDPDMLVVGKLGWGPSLHNTRLTPHEQVLHISMWALQSAALLIGCDMTQMDRFTLSLLTNDEVLSVNQDPLGKPAGRIRQDGDTEVWARSLWDGSHAVGLFNTGDDATKVTVSWSDLGVSGRQPVRNLWTRSDAGAFADSYTSVVPPHGCVLVKVGKPTRTWK